MRDLRQRLMNLERSQEQPQNKPVLPDSQRTRDLHQRLLQLGKTKITPPADISKSELSENQPRRLVAKSSAQRMRELRERRRAQLSKHDNNCSRNSNNSRPRTPPELTAKRMHEFRLRLLKLDKSRLELKSKKQPKGKSKRKVNEVLIIDADDGD